MAEDTKPRAGWSREVFVTDGPAPDGWLTPVLAFPTVEARDAAERGLETLVAARVRLDANPAPTLTERDELQAEVARLRAALARVRDALEGDIVKYDDVTNMLDTINAALLAKDPTDAD